MFLDRAVLVDTLHTACRSSALSMIPCTIVFIIFSTIIQKGLFINKLG